MCFCLELVMYWYLALNAVLQKVTCFGVGFKYVDLQASKVPIKQCTDRQVLA
jgi:hypothetical protein